MSINMSVNIAGIEFKNPVMTASGTFGSGKEYGEFVDINMIGGVVVKGVSIKPWKGNPSPRICETYGGMINSVGLQNEGATYFLENDYKYLKKYSTNIIVNLCGHTLDEYVQVAEVLSECDVQMFELNISCPNVSAGGITFGTDCNMIFKVVGEVKKVCKKPLIVKLSPNVTDITEIAKAAQEAGADAISLINTLLAMKIDIYKKKPVLARGVGGLSGPAIKPVAVRMVHQVAKAVKIPIIGMGGITTGEDAVEFLMAGATAVAVGTANFMNPLATINVIEGIKNYMVKSKITNVLDIINII